jgi:hypothetical protein
MVVTDGTILTKEGIYVFNFSLKYLGMESYVHVFNNLFS